MLDIRFDHICTYHFVLLNHFRYGVKISIHFYLYSSMNDNIHDFQDKKMRNLALHEGMLLLLYEYFKFGIISKKIKNKKEGKRVKRDSNDIDEIYSPSKTEEVELYMDSDDHDSP